MRTLFFILLGGLLGLGWDRGFAHPGHDAQNAPASTEATALVFADFHSPDCAWVNGLLDQLAEAKHLKLQRIFKHAPAHPDAMPAHEAALAAGAQGKFLAMHDLLFKTPKPVGSTLLSAARSLGLNMEQFESALDDRQYRNVVLRDIAEARALGVTTTPTVYINGTRLGSLAELQDLVRRASIPPPPKWESLKNENPVFDLLGSPASGPEDAPVTLVEFTDFRCGFCRLHSQTLDQLAQIYPGRIRRVFKHYPLSMEGAALLPHAGSMVAFAQGNFWGMHRILMESPLGESASDLPDRAKALGLAPDPFVTPTADPQVMAVIRRDQAEGVQWGIRATPTTFLNGRRLVGRQPLEYLAAYVQAILAEKGITNLGALRPMPAGIDNLGVSAPVGNGSVDKDAACERSLPPTGAGKQVPASKN
ncbi:MAG: hypothetical protein FJ405_14755 [Verrucomicrobia bacterium]|nr:hypothetical protein [Verrucomicrobiota bacterium]